MEILYIPAQRRDLAAFVKNMGVNGMRLRNLRQQEASARP
jgi:hypothetical protein